MLTALTATPDQCAAVRTACEKWIPIFDAQQRDAGSDVSSRTSRAFCNAIRDSLISGSGVGGAEPYDRVVAVIDSSKAIVAISLVHKPSNSIAYFVSRPGASATESGKVLIQHLTDELKFEAIKVKAAMCNVDLWTSLGFDGDPSTRNDEDQTMVMTYTKSVGSDLLK